MNSTEKQGGVVVVFLHICSLSVCLSVTRWYCARTTQAMITMSSLVDSFLQDSLGEVHPAIQKGSPIVRALNEREIKKLVFGIQILFNTLHTHSRFLYNWAFFPVTLHQVWPITKRSFSCCIWQYFLHGILHSRLKTYLFSKSFPP